VELASEIESQMEVVAKASLKHQKLQSLLEDNLMMRHQELLDEGVSVEGDARHRGQGSATTQKQRREDLEQRQHKLDDATRISEDLEARLVPRKERRRFRPFTRHTIISYL
jgi:hypothetical protein